MKCVILAAGKGVRMRPLTLKKPKPLLEVNGKALIDHVLAALPPEVDEIIIVVKYLRTQIVKHIKKNYKSLKVTFVLGSDKENVYSFLNTRPYLKDERFLLIYGDEIPYPENVKSCLKEPLSILTFNGGTFDGVMVLNTDIFKYKPTDGIFRSLVEQFVLDHKVSLVECPLFVGGLNTPEDLARVETELKGKHG